MQLLIRNYVQQKKEHEASWAWVCKGQRLNEKRSVNAFILMSDRVSKELRVSAKCFE